MGFDAKWGVLGAADIGANHQRNRIWIVGKISNTNKGRCTSQNESIPIEKTPNKTICNGSTQQMAYTNSAGLGTSWREGLHSKRQTGFIAAPSNPTMGNTSCEGLSFPRSQSNRAYWEQGGRPAAAASWWATEPNVGRVAHGVAARVDRLKAIGNGQVPLCAATAWRILQ